MIARKALRTAAIHLTLGVLIILVGSASRGAFFTRVLVLGGLAIAVGIAAGMLPSRVGAIIDRECDERTKHIDTLAKRTAFAATSVLLLVLWAYELATTGIVLTRTALILLVLWGSGGLAYAYYNRRF
ncbi:MAG: hypothetical protein ACM3XZ_07640 [Betaproteobacteria bacterium]